jgi:hypothetical protein
MLSAVVQSTVLRQYSECNMYKNISLLLHKNILLAQYCNAVSDGLSTAQTFEFPYMIAPHTIISSCTLTLDQP